MIAKLTTSTNMDGRGGEALTRHMIFSHLISLWERARVNGPQSIKAVLARTQYPDGSVTSGMTYMTCPIVHVWLWVPT